MGNINKWIYFSCELLTTAVVVAEVGESPDVAEPDAVPEEAEEKVEATGPVSSLWFLLSEAGTMRCGVVGGVQRHLRVRHRTLVVRLQQRSSGE